MPHNNTHIPSDDIRARFSKSMSKMYREEVPAYGRLLDLVADINQSVLDANPALKTKLEETDNLERINEERHGAIRLGTAKELQMIARVFGVMGMRPVSYYDLTQANVPVHSTAFRTTDAKSLTRSPFRVFCSLLRTELIADDDLRTRAEEILAQRDIFTPALHTLVEKAEKNGGLNEVDTQNFIEQATYTFKWHEDATTDKAFYEALKNADPRAADIVCFKGPHINHLTPRTLDIDIIQDDMPKRGMNAKNVVEGPSPSRSVLLRQTSFKALTEQVRFHGEAGSHTARFGEIEQRGAALTPKGRALYDDILSEVRATIKPALDGSNAAEYMKVLEEKFTRFPATENEWRLQKLAYFQYYAKGDIPPNKDLEQLITDGLVDFIPITYEDFLPVSAAGIFSSNASDKTRQDTFLSSSKDDFEKALGQKVICEFEMYQAMENTSIRAIFG
ncbi:MAG: 2-oxoadipate dioxygenase/decarboxylase HglS [Alphaproteobacteria bacterium]